MSKLAAYYGSGSEKPAVKSFLEGLTRRGYRVEPHPLNPVEPRNMEGVSLAVFSGQGPESKPFRDEANSRGIPSLFLDLGYMRRGGYSNPGGYYQVSLGSLCWVPPVRVPLDRFQSLRLVPRDDAFREGGRWMIAAQVPGDTQHGFSEERLDAYYVRKYRQIVECGIAPDRIFLRKHPSGPAAFRQASDRMEVEIGNEVPINESLSHCQVVVTYNSTTFYDATLLGVPVVCSPEAHYITLANVSPEQLRLRTAPEKIPFLAQMAYAQWTQEEMRRGLPIDFLESAKYL